MQSRRVRRTRSSFLSVNQHAVESPIKPIRRPLTRFAPTRKPPDPREDSNTASPSKLTKRLIRTRSRGGIQATAREKSRKGRELRSNANTTTEDGSAESDGFVDESEGSAEGTSINDAGSALGRRRSRTRPLKRRRLDASSMAAASPLKRVRGRSRKATRIKAAIGFEESPRKRKREDIEASDEDVEVDGDSETAESEHDGDAHMDDGEETADLIAESDQYLLHDAPVTALHRLKKSELVRLWRVAGLWEGPDDCDMDDETQEGDLKKEELVNGIIAARPELPADGSPLNRLSFISRQASRNRSTAQSSPNRSAPSSSEGSADEQSSRPPARQNGAQRSRIRPLRSAGRQASMVSSASESNDTRQADIHARARQSRAPGRKPRNVAFSKHSEESSAAGADDEDTGDQATDADSESEKKRGGSAATGNYRHPPARRAKRQALRAIKATDENQHALDDVAGGPMSEASAGETVGDPTPRPKASATFTRHQLPSQIDSPSRPPAQYRTRARTASFMETPDEEIQDPMTGSDSAAEDGKSQPTSDASAGSGRRRTRASRRGSLEMRLEGMDIDDEVAGSIPQTEDERDVAMRDAVEDEDEDEVESHFDDEDFDLRAASAADLNKLKKDQLIDLCRKRDLDTEATKKELVEYLLSWAQAVGQRRERSPSSTPTAKPASNTEKPISVPQLLQHHEIVADPDTPQRSEAEADAAVDNEGALDLEELGLVGREIPESQIQKGDKIGSGGFKDVYIGKYKYRTKVAICEFRGTLSEMDIREIKLLAEFDHPNIVRLLGLCIPENSTQTPCMVITELCEKGDLFDYIRNASAPPFPKILRMMIDIAQGLEYLHERKPRVIHRDCKSSNILINKKGVCKVGDFGLARVKSTTRSVLRSTVGTCQYQSPELWHPKPRYDYKVDVYSCSMVFWEMLSGWSSERKLYPWEGKNEHWIYENVGRKGARPPTFTIKKTWGTDIVELLERMWQEDPNERPTMTTVVEDLQAILDDAK